MKPRQHVDERQVFILKKVILILALLIIILYFAALEKEEIIIPNESIRFRIIPNSNSVKDIKIKEKIKENISAQLAIIEEESKDLNETRAKLRNSQNQIENTVVTTLKNNNYDMDFKVNYGMNYFPEKNYKGVKYPSGEYESLVIKLGKAEGDNFWCVLFPPLCNMQAENKDKKEYKLFISEILKKYL